jgi:type IV pilus assembly protein PilN
MLITLNLATRPFVNVGPILKQLRMVMAVLALAAIGLVLSLRAFHGQAEAARARYQSIEGQIARVKQERQGYQDAMRQPANAELLNQAELLNRLFEEKGFSWTLAMEDLETVLPGKVQVASIEPEHTKDGHITLHMRVIGPRDRALDLVGNLEHSRRFYLPRMVGESSEAGEGRNDMMEPVSASNRVNFDLLAEYKPDSVGELNAGAAPAPGSEISHKPSAKVPLAVHPKEGPVHPGRKVKPSASSSAIQRSAPAPYPGPNGTKKFGTRYSRPAGGPQ